LQHGVVRAAAPAGRRPADRLPAVLRRRDPDRLTQATPSPPGARGRRTRRPRASPSARASGWPRSRRWWYLSGEVTDTHTVHMVKWLRSITAEVVGQILASVL